jgi:hypothetical protein
MRSDSRPLPGVGEGLRGQVFSKAQACKPLVTGRAPSARFSSRTGPKPENGPRFFEDFKGIRKGDRTSETGERPKIGL